jgi:hypothetical protein
MTSRSDLILQMPALAEAPRSLELAEQLVDTSALLHEQMPEYLGMTAFGSIVRGQAVETSDADVYVYFDGSRTSLQDRKRAPTAVFHENGFIGTMGYATNLRVGYKRRVHEALKSSGVLRADVVALPLRADIIDKQAEFILTQAPHVKFEELEGTMGPQNICGLFHAAIDDGGLASYRERTLQQFAKSEDGEAAWRIVRRTVTRFEAGRDKVAERDFEDASHRYIPRTLQVAQVYYADLQ